MRTDGDEKKGGFLTFQCWTYPLPDGEAAAAVELSQSQLQVEQWQAAEDQHDAVRDEEGACLTNSNQIQIFTFV